MNLAKRIRGAVVPPSVLRQRSLYAPPTRFSRPGITEYKYVDADNPFFQVSNGGQVTLLNGVAQGTDFNQRIGRYMYMKSLEFDASCIVDPLNNLPTQLRVALVYDKQPNGVFPAYQDIFNNATINSRKNLNNEQRFIILREWLEQMQSTVDEEGRIISSENGMRHLHGYIKLNMPVQFEGVANTMGSISTGAVYMVTVTDMHHGVQVQYTSRIRFTDN